MFKRAAVLLLGLLAACGGETEEPISITTGPSTNNARVNNTIQNTVPSPVDNNSTTVSTNNGTVPVTTGPTSGMTTSEAVDAPRRWTRTAALTHDVDRILGLVLESDRLAGACDRWVNGARDEETKMLCGKWMFFYETFGTVGIPKDILSFSQKWFAESYYGVGFSNFGFIPDPGSNDGMPIGLAPTTGELDGLETRAFTCAGCHFGQMPDGRYAVGYGNMNLDYGRFLAGLGAPLSLSLNENDANTHPQIRAELAGPVAEAKQNSSYMIELGILGIGLISAGPNGLFDAEGQARFLALPRGTMDFMTPPLVDDEQWTVSRILSLWNIPDEAQRQAAGMQHESLSWTGGAKRLDSFISGFVAIGVADPAAWGPERIEPLRAYLQSLQVPALEATLSPPLVDQGAQVFVDAGCASCHVGPSGESNRAYSFAEIGTDGAMEFIFNPDANDELCCGFDQQPGPDDGYEVTRGVKAPRMTGLENQTKYLHNGSVTSLRQLFCLQPRLTDNNYAQGSQGHEYGCELSEADRTALIVYLNSL